MRRKVGFGLGWEMGFSDGIVARWIVERWTDVLTALALGGVCV